MTSFSMERPLLWCFGTMIGSYSPFRSLGIWMVDSPCSVWMVLVKRPFLELPVLLPATSCFSYPRCASISPCNICSSTWECRSLKNLLTSSSVLNCLRNSLDNNSGGTSVFFLTINCVSIWFNP